MLPPRPFYLPTSIPLISGQSSRMTKQLQLLLSFFMIFTSLLSLTISSSSLFFLSLQVLFILLYLSVFLFSEIFPLLFLKNPFFLYSSFFHFFSILHTYTNLVLQHRFLTSILNQVVIIFLFFLIEPYSLSISMLSKHTFTFLFHVVPSFIAYFSDIKVISFYRKILG